MRFSIYVGVGVKATTSVMRMAVAMVRVDS